MLKIIVYKTVAVILLALPLHVFAEDADIAKTRENVKKIFPGESFYKIKKTPVPGLYEVEFSDGFIYLTQDGKYAVKGEIIDVKRNISITEQKRSKKRLAVINKIDDSEMLAFSPVKKNYKHTINVFTDIDCSYCRRMHNEMAQYHKHGIRVRYLFYPRAGKGSTSYKKAVTVWCDKDRQNAMNLAKQGRSLPNKTCANPVDKHMQVADELGVTGTPTIILEDGGRLPGYVPANRLSYELNRRKLVANQVQE